MSALSSLIFIKYLEPKEHFNYVSLRSCLTPKEPAQRLFFNNKGLRLLKFKKKINPASIKYIKENVKLYKKCDIITILHYKWTLHMKGKSKC